MSAGRGFLSDLPAPIRPIFWAVVASFVWFIVLSPLVNRGFGAQLKPEVLASGTATVGDCQRHQASIRPAWSCRASVRWQDGSVQQGDILATQDISRSNRVEVVKRPVQRSQRSTNIENFNGSIRVVTADFPAGALESVAHLTMVNLAAVAVIWGSAFAGVHVLNGREARNLRRQREQEAAERMRRRQAGQSGTD